jgi:hypothetical protein
MVSSEGCYLRPRTVPERSSYALVVRDLMLEFKFEVRIPHQIQTVKMAVGCWATFQLLFEYWEFAGGGEGETGGRAWGPARAARARARTAGPLRGGASDE